MSAFKNTVGIMISAVLCLTLLAGCGNNSKPVAVKHFEFPEHKAAEAALMAENGKFSLSLNPDTLEFSVSDITSGRVWYSTPATDPTYGGSTDGMHSLYTLTAKVDGTDTTFDSYTDGVSNGNYEIITEKDGFTINTAVGKSHQITSLDLPQAVEASRFESVILSKLSKEESKEILSRYTLYSMSDDGLSERKKESALEKYPTLAEKDLYIINNGVPDYSAEKINTALNKIGYDNDEVIKDNSENGVKITPEETMLFDVGIKLALTDEGFEIIVDCSRLTDTANPVTDISVLPYFDASYLESDTGFLLLPDGSGSIVNIDGSSSQYPNYVIKLYGKEKTVSETQTGSDTENAVLPVFGMSKNDSSFTAVIDKGDAVSSVCTKLKGAQTVSSVYCSLNPAQTADVDAGYTDAASGSLINMTQPVTYTGTVHMAYILDSSHNGLGAMADAVSKYLSDNEMIKQQKHEPRIRLEIIGAIDKKTSILGIIPTSESVAVTDFETAGEIAGELHESGVGTLELIYRGWCNGGLYTNGLNKIKVEKVLNGKSGLEKLEKQLTKSGDILTLNVSLLTVENTSGFSSRLYAARALGNTVSRKYIYDTATGNAFKERTGTYIAPEEIKQYVSDFFLLAKKIPNVGIQADDIGKILYSEMNSDCGNTREDTKNIISETLSGHTGITVSSGNIYTLASAGYVSDIPLDSSRYKREDYAVPFLQMVLRGTVGYSSKPVNMSGDWKEQLLRAAAFGADVTFAIGNSDNSTYYDTYFSDYAVTAYDNWKDMIIKTSAKMNTLSSALRESRLTDYLKIEDGVYLSAFENGSAVAANYNKQTAVTAYGEIPPQDWILVTKGETK